jgi:ribosomal protein S18 acetylase RimI-like enzyme
VSRVSVRVRPAELPDVPALVGLTQSIDFTTGSFSGSPLIDPAADRLSERFAAIIDDGTRAILVGIDDGSGDPIGLLVARREERDAIDPDPVLHISHLMVAPRHRRRGVGRALLSAAVQVAEEDGLDRIVITAGAGSREANRYLSRIGFAPLFVNRVAPITVLRRSLGLADVPERMAVLRRARLVRAQRGGLSARAGRRS